MEIDWADAYEIGADDAMNGASEDDNAFMEDTQAHQAWIAGFKSVCLGPVEI